MHIDKGAKDIVVKNGTISGANNSDYGGIYIDKATVLFEDVNFISNRNFSFHSSDFYSSSFV